MTSPHDELEAETLVEGDGAVHVGDRHHDVIQQHGKMPPMEFETILYAVDGPVATVEEQAFRILAPERMAEIHVALGEDEPAKRCLTTARRIRAEPWGRGMTLVAVTGWGQQQDRKRSADAGFDHHLVKPIGPEAVRSLVTGSIPAGTQ